VLLNSIRQIEDGYIYRGVRTLVSTIYTQLHIWFESALIITELDLLRNRQRIYQNCYIYKGSCARQTHWSIKIIQLNLTKTYCGKKDGLRLHFYFDVFN
jgi:hypothetical protein